MSIISYFRLNKIRYTGGCWVNEEVLVRVCDDGGDRYRFGFNGMLKDNEWAGMGTHLDFGARIYDSRGGRWLSVNLLAAKYPGISTYAFVANSTINAIDPDGRYIIFIDELRVWHGARDQAGYQYNVMGGKTFSAAE